MGFQVLGFKDNEESSGTANKTVKRNLSYVGAIRILGNVEV